MITNKKHILISYPIVAVLFALDQVTKYLFTNVYKTLIPNVLSLYYSENTGAAWSILTGKVFFLAIMSALFLIVLIIFSHKFKEKTVYYSITYAFIIAGALGNLYDRIFFGFVRDFIQADFISFMSFPIFNLADSLLVIGVIMFAIFVLIIYPINLRGKKTKWKTNFWLMKII